MYVLACGHARATVRVAYGRAILFLLMNDTDEVPEIAVMFNNLGRVSLIFLLFSWTNICRAWKASSWQARKSPRGPSRAVGYDPQLGRP